MTGAAILSLEDFRDTQRRAEMRQQLHDRFDQWLNQLEDRMQDRSPTWEELTQAIFVLHQELTQAVTDDVVEYVHRAAVAQRTTPCPRCGQTLSARGPQERTVETLVGAMRLRRPYFDCEACQRGSASLDTALALTGRRQQSDVQKAAVQLTAVGILGEPGVGKSRLLYEFRRRLEGQQVTYLDGRCLSYGSATPYLPVLDLLRDHCGIIETDRPEAVVEKVRSGLQEVGIAPDEWAPYLLHLLEVQAGTERLTGLPSETLKARTFETLRQLSMYSSRQRPLILAVEDLQWSDQTSEAFLASLVERMGGAPILLLTTYRPEYRPPWLGKSYITQLALPPLAPDDSLRLVRGVLQSEHVPDQLARAILAKAEGNPFFLEEIVQTLVEQGGTEIQLPATVQVVLAARIDRLPAEVKALLQTLAVLGRECSWRLVTQVIERPDEALQRWLKHLQAAEFLHEGPSLADPTYTFKQALTHDVAYASLPVDGRQWLHEHAGQAIEALYHDRLEEHYSELAHHYRRSRNAAKALYYLEHAGQQAERRSAYAEAISHLTTALELLTTLPETPERTQQELRLQTMLGRALIATKGYGAPDVERTYARALELCGQVGGDPALLPDGVGAAFVPCNAVGVPEGT